MALPGGPHLARQARTLTAMALVGLVALSVSIALAVGGGGHGTASVRREAPFTTMVGSVSGIANPCVGVTTIAGDEARPVRVMLSHGTTPVAEETVTGDHRFLLDAVPGRYLLTSDQFQRRTAFPVTVRAGVTTGIDLFVSCK